VNKDCIQGCIQTLSHLLEVIIVFNSVESNSAKLNQHFVDLTSNILVPTLSINDQQILSASFALLNRLLGSKDYAALCITLWTSDAVLALTTKILTVAVTSTLVTVSSSALETMEKFLQVFPQIAVQAFNDCKGMSLYS
jgi:hypothetical protein